ncbi:MAG: PadR family transcriptional regulator [Minwuia sp.]|nr:PadR family transcriptional regulator [Minwuia sp.]
MDIRTLCLGILTLRDATGYEIKKVFEDELSHFYEASFGSIYPALNRMTDDGWIIGKAEAQDGRPDKKVYSITSAGRMAFMDALDKKPRKDRIRSEFLAMMMFSDLMTPSRIAHLIDERLKGLATKIAELEDCPDDRGNGEVSRFLRGFGHAMYVAEQNYLEENRHLVEAQALMAHAAAD